MMTDRKLVSETHTKADGSRWRVALELDRTAHENIWTVERDGLIVVTHRGALSEGWSDPTLPDEVVDAINRVAQDVASWD